MFAHRPNTGEFHSYINLAAYMIKNDGNKTGVRIFRQSLNHIQQMRSTTERSSLTVRMYMDKLHKLRSSVNLGESYRINLMKSFTRMQCRVTVCEDTIGS